jgi:hypothetical protein
MERMPPFDHGDRFPKHIGMIHPQRPVSFFRVSWFGGEHNETQKKLPLKRPLGELQIPKPMERIFQ